MKQHIASCRSCWRLYESDTDLDLLYGGTCAICRRASAIKDRKESRKKQHQAALDACWLGTRRNG